MYTMIFGSKTESPILKTVADSDGGIFSIYEGIVYVGLNEETGLCEIMHRGLYGKSMLYGPESLYHDIKGRGASVKLEVAVLTETMMGSLGLMYQYTVRAL